MNQRILCVTGGTSGIGRDIACHFLEAGWKVVAIGKGEKHANELKNATHKYADSLDVLTGDVSTSLFCDRITKYIQEKYGALHVLVNSAGTITAGGIKVESAQDWERTIATNLSAPFLIVKSLLSLLQASENASVINISSVCSLRTCSSLSYSVSKAGTDMFTKVLAKELASDGIRVNAVNPGVVRTNLQYSAGLFETEKEYDTWIEKMEAFHPLGRVGEPHDVTQAVAFLVSEKASWITGAILSVDGGRAVA